MKQAAIKKSNTQEPSVQNGVVAQQKAFVDNSPAATAQRQRSEMIANSPQVTAQRERMNILQRVVEEEPVQAKFSSDSVDTQSQQAPRPNNTGLPDNLKSGIESLSGMSMDNVKVHYNSSQPAQLQALAYAQGNDIHVGPGQEQHLPHEAWHVVQQRQGRVQPTMQMKGGVPINDDAGLEEEADVMGAKALQAKFSPASAGVFSDTAHISNAVQRKSYEVSRTLPITTEMTAFTSDPLTKIDQKTQLEVPTKDPKTGKEKARAKILGKLREEYPLSPQDNQGTALERDQRRGEEFARRKQEAEASLVESPDGSVLVPGAHVEGIAPGERARRGSGEATGVKKIAGGDWIGAHLVKCEWGGEDNMWNVVAWPQAAENKWAKEFEYPIDRAFTNRTERAAEIQIHVTKEDEELDKQKVEGFILQEMSKLPDQSLWANQEDKARRIQKVESSLVNKRWAYNRAVESVPLSAAASSHLGATRLSKADTNWEFAADSADKAMIKAVQDEIAALPTSPKLHERAKVVGGQQAEVDADDSRKKERTDAWKQETDNYTPGFEHVNTVK